MAPPVAARHLHIMHPTPPSLPVLRYQRYQYRYLESVGSPYQYFYRLRHQLEARRPPVALRVAARHLHILCTVPAST